MQTQNTKINDQNPFRIILEDVRLNWLWALSPFIDKKTGEETKYLATILLPKSREKDAAKVKAIIESAVKEGGNKPHLWKGKTPKLTLPMKDGDEKQEITGQPVHGPEAKGCWVIKSSSNKDFKPFVVGADLKDLTDASEVYSGMYANVCIRAFPYANNQYGVSFILEGIQKVRDGEPLAESKVEKIKPADIFKALEKAPAPVDSVMDAFAKLNFGE